MDRHIIILPDGTQVSSGANTVNAIQSVALTECVNDSRELTLGSTCASMLEVSLICPNGDLRIAAGEELTVFREDDSGTRHAVGIFITEEPTRPTIDTMKIVAYDRVNRLEKDLSQWLASLTDWPYKLYDFASLVCQACGVVLANTSLPNGEYLVRAFSADGITGRKLMQWVGQIAGRFCRANKLGQIEFAWYTPSHIAITADGPCFYYQNTLKAEAYETFPIEKVQLRLTEDDVGAVWPDGEGEKNTYPITGNYLLTSDSTDVLQPVAQTLYEMLRQVCYTPCTVVIPETAELHAGHTVQITDQKGKTITAYVMSKVSRDRRDTLECTGSYRRDSSAVFNNQSYKALSGKALELRLKIEGLSAKASDLQSDVNTTDEGVLRIRETVAELTVQADALKSGIQDTQKTLDGMNGKLQQTQTRVSTLEQTSQQVSLNLESMTQNGASKVTTTTGFTFDEKGLQVDQSDSPTKTQVTPDGMKVFKKSSENSEVLSATSEGVDATNLHAKTYLIIGGRSRFEDYGNNRTGCFPIGGG